MAIRGSLKEASLPDVLQLLAMKHIESKKDKKKEAYEDIVWALLNTKEFLFSD